MIRELTVQELPGYLNVLGPLFYAEGSLPGVFNADIAVKKWTQLIESKLGFVFGLEENGEPIGALGALIFPDLNSDELTVTEAFWYVRPDHRGGGLRLLRAFEDRAKATGAKRLIMAHLHNLHPVELKDLYERLGYRAIETNYLKEIAA